METIKTIWDYPLFSFGDNPPILVSQLILVALILLVGYFFSRFVVHLLRKRLLKTGMRADASYLLERIVFYLLLLIVAVTALGLLNVPLAAFAFVSGALAIGVGFGAQNLINNFISGWILLMERPVRIGDFIEIDNYTGTVDQIGNRSTRIHRVDGVHMLIPNSQMLERVVVNWTLIDDRVRTTLRVGVAYGSPVKKVAELMEQAVAEQPEVLKDPPITVIFEDFGDNALIFDAYFWADVGRERMLRQIRSRVRFRIDELFAEHGIVIAFPQRDIHMDTLKPLDIRLVSEDNERRG